VCGIVGLLYKQAPGPIGAMQVKMLDALYRRGPDSTGVALYGTPSSDYVVHARLGGNGHRDALFDAIRGLDAVRDVSAQGTELRAQVEWQGELEALARTIEAADHGSLDVTSVGRAMEIVKDVGSASDLDRVYGLSSFTGTHAIGHTRMATESRVDVLHSHPFWARPFADIAVVHNGHITNGTASTRATTPR
jgi:glutamate synthase domain-containing protein 1